MKIPHYLHRAPSGVWHYRQRLPRDLAAMLDQQAIKRSLHTCDLRSAQRAAFDLSGRYALIFAAARQGQGMGGKHWDDEAVAAMMRNISEAAPGGVSRWKVNGPGGWSVETTTGTREDHEQAREVAKELFKSRAELAQAAPVSAPGEPRPRGPSISELVKVPIKAGEAAEAFLKSIAPGKDKQGQATGARPKTHTIKAAAVNGFVSHYGARKPLDAAGRYQIGGWVDALRASGLVTSTITNKLSYLGEFFTWAAARDHYPAFKKDDRPTKGHIVNSPSEKRKRRAMGFKSYTIEQVQKLYTPEALTKLSEAARWGALIGLYTGARVAEVGQLALVDFTTVEGVPCLTITGDGEGQSIKNDDSGRTIPIHPDLLALGLMERVERLREAGEKRLFPGVKMDGVNGAGNWLSKAFSKHILRAQFPKLDKGRYGFHSLRKTAVETMKAAKVPLEWRCAYVGHNLEEEHVEAYSGEYGPAQMLEAVAPGLSWKLDLDGLRRVLHE